MERRAVIISGIVQGVGFRPFVRHLAAHWSLGGFVANQAGEVRIEVEGASAAIQGFLDELEHRPPPLAMIDRVSWHSLPPTGERDFVIAPSIVDDTPAIFLSPDSATCDACRRELFDPGDRRFRDPFLNCTHCGPRLTIIQGSPYDRERTTMAGFPMCPACRAEYDDPANRRYHAQPTACPACGPRLRLYDAVGDILPADPIAEFTRRVRAGAIGALKGLGGFHLVCDAGNADAVNELRRRKRRFEKPFAVMVRDTAAAQRLCEVREPERRLLESPAAPIVLLRKRDDVRIADAVAPNNPFLGILLPYTPLHWLLVSDMGDVPIVMTSGNASDEPIATDNDDALRRLAGIADCFLMHNRPIHVRCDDSVVRVVDDRPMPIRRSRGFAPRPIELPIPCPRPILAVGGQLKGTFAVASGRHAFVSHHLGDLDHVEAYQAFRRDVDLYLDLFRIRPECIVHDLHPNYTANRFARDRAADWGCRLVAVQHHHAHLASCMAENGLREPAIGVAFDGAGLGTDGTVWGGEFLVGDYREVRRAAWLRPVPLPGGERAIHEPWRMAVAHLADASVECRSLTARIPGGKMHAIQQLLDHRALAPLTSSAGRLFDAVASLAGVRDDVIHEGQAAIELEWLATSVEILGRLPYSIVARPEGVEIDVRPLIQCVGDDADRGVPAASIARRFHTTVVAIIAEVCEVLRGQTGIDAVVLTGGVFQNALLRSECAKTLEARGFRVFQHRLVPPNDGGLSLGQLAVAAALLT